MALSVLVGNLNFIQSAKETHERISISGIWGSENISKRLLRLLPGKQIDYEQSGYGLSTMKAFAAIKGGLSKVQPNGILSSYWQ